MRKIPCEVYAKIVGYCRPVSSWNPGKQEEFALRSTFDESMFERRDYVIGTRAMCSGCRDLKEILSRGPLIGFELDLDTVEGKNEMIALIGEIPPLSCSGCAGDLPILISFPTIKRDDKNPEIKIQYGATRHHLKEIWPCLNLQ